jgi:hypothetical protein
MGKNKNGENMERKILIKVSPTLYILLFLEKVFPSTKELWGNFLENLSRFKF